MFTSYTHYFAAGIPVAFGNSAIILGVPRAYTRKHAHSPLMLWAHQNFKKVRDDINLSLLPMILSFLHCWILYWLTT